MHAIDLAQWVLLVDVLAASPTPNHVYKFATMAVLTLTLAHNQSCECYVDTNPTMTRNTCGTIHYERSDV